MMNGIFRFGNMIHAGSLAAVVVIAVFITSCTGDHDTVQAPVTSVNATVVRIDLVPIPETYITTVWISQHGLSVRFRISQCAKAIR